MRPPLEAGAEAVTSTVGHRVAARRTSLGLERESVAHRAGMSAAYLAYVEEQDGRPSASALRRLADALHTTVEHLYGESALDPELSLSRNRPTESVGPEPRKHAVTKLTAQECHLLMGSVPVGRVAFVVNGPPVVLPVNFTLMGTEIVVQTSATSRLAEVARGRRLVSFEVDDFDEHYRLGWSVLCHGQATLSIEAGDQDHQASTLRPPWIGDDRHTVVVIKPTAITGRRIGIA